MYFLEVSSLGAPVSYTLSLLKVQDFKCYACSCLNVVIKVVVHNKGLCMLVLTFSIVYWNIFLIHGRRYDFIEWS